MLKSALSKSNALDSIRMYLLVAGKRAMGKEKGVKEATTAVDMGRRQIISDRVPFLQANPSMGFSARKVPERMPAIHRRATPPRGAYQRKERFIPSRSRRPAGEEGGTADASAPARVIHQQQKGATLAPGYSQRHRPQELEDRAKDGNAGTKDGEGKHHSSDMDPSLAEYLKKMGVNYVFFDQRGNVETSKQSLKRVELWEFMARSLKNSAVEPLIRDDEDTVKWSHV